MAKFLSAIGGEVETTTDWGRNGLNPDIRFLIQYNFTDLVIRQKQDSLDMVAACLEHGFEKLIAGAVLQKLANYRLQSASHLTVRHGEIRMKQIDKMGDNRVYTD